MRRLRPDPGGQGRLLPAVLAAGPLPGQARRRPAAGRRVGPAGRRSPALAPAVLRPDAACAARTARCTSTAAGGAPVKPPPQPAGRPAFRWIQPRLFEARRDFTRFDEERPPTSATRGWPGALYLAWRRRRGPRLAAGSPVRRPAGADHRAVRARARRHRPVLRDHPVAAALGLQRRADRRGAPGDGRAGRRPACRPSRPGWTASSTAWPPASAPTSRPGCGPCATAPRAAGPGDIAYGLEPPAPRPPGAAGLVRPL